ncbi:putative 3,9-dihydroxypterocarpan 6A-monooxygenase [Helianthus annuus]|uniref:3,9-dihydroxypterocarpan 6A-monooxygenase n=2 Tax=Helianthus annuus TaxID=4232 RepID=A0A9K3HCN1_HELAN|nr:putative 3,9-dihydroxypterocarpan 6A-monooxygenase [Helianthus annuus]KAJ0477553.1 putative 3,9-dihydroxypterocarpan 6A-monooxygenase [Helianthus annuus]KAJ0482052.1 putative 3,9-dihydroxypterocarpan 6A-monooxygenase [Helianthus annuus]KAJ0498383.1 putative 3,9-dihydroxypterocarpan 6A-monooxygenase [Helianthus annuus]KAJ0664393.1 putative 3,9-dihydroxypterocarpan 6A-monooxygenase [Helianthus annuus]
MTDFQSYLFLLSHMADLHHLYSSILQIYPCQISSSTKPLSPSHHWTSPSSCVVVCSPETAKEFLKTYENAYLDCPRNSATIYLTYGSKYFAFTPYEPYWKFMKKIVMSQLLNGAIVDSLIQVRQDEINRFIKSLSRKASMWEAINLNAELVKVTNNLISRILLSERCSENAGEADNIRKLIFEITDVLGTFKLPDYIWLFKSLDLQGFGKRVKDFHRRFDVLVEKIIKEHEAARTQGLQSQEKDLLNITGYRRRRKNRDKFHQREHQSLHSGNNKAVIYPYTYTSVVSSGEYRFFWRVGTIWVGQKNDDKII